MAYNATEARAQMLSDIDAAAAQISGALAALSEAYEVLDEELGDELERQVFGPVQHAYGRLKRTHTEFAARHGLPDAAFAAGSPGPHSSDPRVYIERAVEAAEEAEQALAELQDSMLPVEVGDPELRAGLSETRALLAQAPTPGRRLVRMFGR